MKKEEIITVLDVGARYGIHPSWKALKDSDLMRTYAFDIDQNEVEALQKKYYNNPNYFIYQLGIGEEYSTKVFNILSHKGQSSFFTPNKKSSWFKNERLNESIIEKKISVDIIPLDSWCADNNVLPDFIKTDTEGFDYFVLKGAKKSLKNVLGVRCEVHFSDTFIGQPKFDKVFSLLLEHGFQLANFDYNGKGDPQSYFCPNNRYGIISGTEAVFIRNDDFYLSATPSKFLKIIIFFFLNNMEDLAFNLMIKRKELFVENKKNSMILFIEKRTLLATKKIQYIPGPMYEMSKVDYSKIFGKPYPDKHKFYEDTFLNPA